MNLNKIKNWSKKINKKAEEDLYIRVLLWAHERQENGFTWEEMKKNFNLSSMQEIWIRKIFLTSNDQDRKFIEALRNDETIRPNQYFYSLNEKGITASINYKNLAHAEKNSSIALWFAGFSIFIAFIGISLQLRQTRINEIQAVPEQINQKRSYLSSLEFCKQIPDSLESGQYWISSGKPMSCKDLNKIESNNSIWTKIVSIFK